jgi:hypothetical protein
VETTCLRAASFGYDVTLASDAPPDEGQRSPDGREYQLPTTASCFMILLPWIM